MYKGKTIGVVVPCYDEETQIHRVLATMPAFVDRILVVDDCSNDGTVGVIERFIADQGAAGERVTVIHHERNQGVGRAITTGYLEALRLEVEIIAVMAGDGQMPPEELELIIDPVVTDQADYAKANRLFYRDAWKTIPKHRFVGNGFLSMLTKIASGYWHSADSQTGWTAISREALGMLDLNGVYARYGYPNDMLVRLNVWDMRVVDVPVAPTYNVGERSKMKIWKVVPTMSWLIFKRFLWRMLHKYVIRDFHPLVMFYAAGAAASGAGGLIGLYLVYKRLWVGTAVATTSAMFSTLLSLIGLQLLLFGMWFDMENNRGLRVRYRRPVGSDPSAPILPAHGSAEAEEDASETARDDAP